MAYRMPPSLQKRMVELGLVPKHCQSVDLFIPADGALVLRYEVQVSREHIAQLGALFTEFDEYNKAHERNPPPPPEDVGGLTKKGI